MLREKIYFTEYTEPLYIYALEVYDPKDNSNVNPYLDQLLLDITYRNHHIHIKHKNRIAKNMNFLTIDPQWIHRISKEPNQYGLYDWIIILMKNVIDFNKFNLEINPVNIRHYYDYLNNKPIRLFHCMRYQRRLDGILGTSTLSIDLDTGDLLQSTGLTNSWDNQLSDTNLDYRYITNTVFPVTVKKKV